MLPAMPGTDVCRKLREEDNTVPIVMLTAKDAEIDRVLGLEVGADDYVSKPFSSAELVSRIRAIFRRREYDRSSGDAVRQIGGLRLDFARHQVYVDGADVQLTPSEFKLLALLAEQPERVFSRRQLMEHLWESSFVGDEHACDVHISNLRKKIERDPAYPERIVTVRSFGYKLVPA
jgi:two-component system response regulator RegX3